MTRTHQQIVNTQRLLNYYRLLPEGVHGWSYGECVAWVLRNQLSITPSLETYYVGDALGIDELAAHHIVYGVPDQGISMRNSLVAAAVNPLERQRLVVAMLEHLLASGEVDWDH